MASSIAFSCTSVFSTGRSSVNCDASISSMSRSCQYPSGLLVSLFNRRQIRFRRERGLESLQALQPDLAERVGLREPNGLQLHQFQQRQKQADHGPAAALPLEQLAYGEGAVAALVFENSAHVADHVRH